MYHLSMGITLAQLRTFHAVARHVSVGKAAAELMVSEPAVSASVSALASELGVPLTEREGRGIRLTPAALMLAEYAGRILGLEERARRAVREASGVDRHIRMTAVTTAGEYVLPSLLAEFLALNPGVRVSLEVANRAQVISSLLNDEADIGIGGRPPTNVPVSGNPFRENELVVVAEANHALCGEAGLELTDLAAETWLLREPGSGTRQSALDFIHSGGVEPDSTMNLGSNGAIARAVALGLGISLMSRSAVLDELAGGELCLLDVQGTPLDRPWYVLHREESVIPESATALVEFLLSSA